MQECLLNGVVWTDFMSNLMMQPSAPALKNDDHHLLRWRETTDITTSGNNFNVNPIAGCVACLMLG